MHRPARERADSAHPPRHLAIKTGSHVAGCCAGGTGFGRRAARSLAGQTMVGTV